MPTNQTKADDLGFMPEQDDLGFVPEQQDDPSDDLGFQPEAVASTEPDMAPMKAHFNEKIKTAKEATSFKDYLEAGWDMSVTGLVASGKPDVVLPENASMAAQIASGIATVAGDLPAIIPGFFAGGVAGGAVGSAAGPVGTGVGATLGAGAGSNALPAAIRKTLMDHYEKGDIKDFSDFWSRASAVFIETMKQGTIGAASMGAGVAVGKVAAPLAGKALGTTVSKVAPPTAEIATMTTLGAAIEGEMPNAEDFTVAAGMVAVIHGLTKVGTGGTKHVSAKMRQIYAETGIKPEQVVEDAKTNPIVQQELLIDNGKIPEAYKTEAGVEKIESKPPVEAVSMADVLNEPPPQIEPSSLAVRTILDGVGEKPVPEKSGYSVQKAYTDFVDKLNPIKQVSEEGYKLSRMANDFKAKVKHIVERGTIDYKTLEINGKGLNDIVAPFKDKLREFEAFLISKRALDYERRGMSAGFDLEAANEVIRLGEKKYGKAAKELVEFQRRNLQYLKDAGLISDKSMKAMMKAGEAYIPLKRIMEPEQFETKRTKGGVLKRVKGIEEGRDIKTQSPMLSILENTEAVMRLAEKNRAIDQIVRDADPSVMEKVKAKSRPIEVSEKEIAKFFEENGIDADPEAFSIFRPNALKLAENEFEVIRDGKREVYRTDLELAEAIKSLDGSPGSQNILMKIARGITAIKKIGITLTPEFITRNFLRDQGMTAVTSKGHVIPFVDVVVAMKDLVSKNDTYYKWLKSGGAQGAFLELNERYLMKDVFKLEKETGMLESTWNVVKDARDIALSLAHTIELAPRLAEFKKVSKGASGGEAVFRGGFASREVTLDFQRIGARMSAFNAITAFTNATIQGADKTARAIRDNPTGTMMKAAAYITTPSLLLWWANKDDERYKSLPRWEKDLYWHIITDDWQPATEDDHADLMPEHLKMVGDGKLLINKGIVFRIPKPHEIGVLFGSLPERLAEKFLNGNPRAMKDFDETVVSILTPGIIPDAAAPALEQWANKSIFTGRDLIPFSLEKVAPEYRYTDYTSDTAKQLSKMTSYLAGPERAASPIVIDNYVRQWSGTIGQYAVQIADKGLREAGVVPDGKAEMALSDIPTIKAFVSRYPGSGAQQITDFYDRKKKVDQKLATIKLLSKKQGMEEELDRYVESANEEFMGTMSGTEKALSNSRKIIHSINDNPDIPPREKRQLIDAQYYHMIEAAKAAIEIADEMDKNMEQAKKDLGVADAR